MYIKTLYHIWCNCVYINKCGNLLSRHWLKLCLLPQKTLSEHISVERAQTQQPLQQCRGDLLPAIYSLLFREHPVLIHTCTFCHPGIWHMIRVCLDTGQSVIELSLLDVVLETGPGIVCMTFDFSRQCSCMASIQAWSDLIQPDAMCVC